MTPLIHPPVLYLTSDDRSLHNARWALRTSGRYHKITYEISLHAIGTDHTPESYGIWCSYVYLREAIMPADKFESIWLPDKPFQVSSESPVRITHDYMRSPIADAPWHGGATYYEKQGHTNGHRCVKVGCDWNHLWDMEKGFATLDEVVANIKEVIDHYTQHLNIHDPST